MSKSFNGIIILTIFNTLFLPSASGFAKTLAVYLKHVELSIVTLIGFPLFVGDSSLLNYHKLPNVSVKLSLNAIKFYISIVM